MITLLSAHIFLHFLSFSALGYGDVCDAADDQCDATRGLACNNATLRCACSHTRTSYKSVIGECTAKALFGEYCYNDTGCFYHVPCE